MRKSRTSGSVGGRPPQGACLPDWQVSEYQWQESFRRISVVLPALTKKELDIIGDVATEFVKNSASDRDIRPLNEQELWARIDHSIEQADRGEVLTLEETMESIDQEFEL